MIYTQYDEADHLLETLIFTLNMILTSEGASRERISHSYGEAKALAASIPLGRNRCTAADHRVLQEVR